MHGQAIQAGTAWSHGAISRSSIRALLRQYRRLLQTPMVIVATDAAGAEAIPEPVRFAADIASTEDLGVIRNEQPVAADGFIVWLEGEELLQRAVRKIFSCRIAWRNSLYRYISHA